MGRARTTLRLRLTLWFAGALLVLVALFGGALATVMLAEEDEDRADEAAGEHAEVGNRAGKELGKEPDLRRWLTGLAVALPLTLVAAAVGAWVLAGRALRPLDEIADVAGAVEAHNLSRRVPVRGGAEVERLATTLNQLFARLESSLAEVARFTADASHELRTPLAAAAAALEVALRHPPTPLDQSNHVLREAAGAALEEIEHLSELIDALLVLARGDAGELATRRLPVDLATLVAEVMSVYAPVAEERGLSLTLHSSTAEPPVAMADRALVARALANLIANALDFAAHEVRLEIALADGAGAAVGTLRLTVSDDGPGVSEAERPRLFQRFFRGDSARPRRQRGGHGLGLGLVAAIARAHGGTASYEPSPDGGSRFTLTLPAA